MQNPHFFWGYSVIRMIGNALTSYWKLLVPYFAVDFGLNGFEVGIIGHLKDVMGIFGTAIAYAIFRKTNIAHIIPIQLVVVFFVLVGIILIPYFEDVRIIYLVFIGCCIALVMRINVVGQFQVLHAVKIGDHERGKNLGTIQSMGDIGSFAVVTLGGFLIVYFGWVYATICILFALMICGIVYLKFQEKLQVHDHVSEKFEPNIPMKSWGTKKAFMTIVVLITDNIASYGIITFLPLLLLQNGIGLALFPYISGSVMIGSIVGRKMGGMSDIYGYKKMFLISEIIMVILLISFTVVQDFWIALIGAVFIGIGLRGTAPIKGVLLMQSVPKEYFHKVHTYSSNANAIAGIVSGLTWGALATVFDYRMPFYGMAVFGILSMVSIVLLHRVKE